MISFEHVVIDKHSEPLVIHITRNAIREFAEAINDPNPLYQDEEAARQQGYASVIAPPTFAICFGFQRIPGLEFPLAPLEIPSPDVRMLYLDQDFCYGVPIVAGDTITTEGWVESLKMGAQAGMARLGIACEGKNQRQELVYHARATFLLFLEDHSLQ